MSPGARSSRAAIAPQPRRGAPFVARRAVNLHGCAPPLLRLAALSNTHEMARRGCALACKGNGNQDPWLAEGAPIHPICDHDYARRRSPLRGEGARRWMLSRGKAGVNHSAACGGSFSVLPMTRIPPGDRTEAIASATVIRRGASK